MKSARLLACLWLASLFFSTMQAGGLVETIAEVTKKFASPTQELAIGVVAEKQKQREEVVTQREKIKKESDGFSDKSQTIAAETQNLIDQAETALSTASDDEFLKQKVLVLSETLQAVKDVQRSYSSLISLLDRFIKELDSFLQDPDFNEYRSQYSNFDRAYHAFDDIIKLHDQIVDQEHRVSMLSDQEKSALAELDSLRQSASAHAQMYKKKRADLNKAMDVEESEGPYSGFAKEQLVILLQLEATLFGYRKKLDELSEIRVKRKVEYSSMDLFIEKSHLSILKEYFRKAKPGIRVSELDIVEEKQELTAQKKLYYAQKEDYRRKIDEYVDRLTLLEKELNVLSEQQKVPLGRDLDEWDRKVSQSAEAYLSFCQVAMVNSTYRTLEYRRELLQSQEALLDEKFELKEVQVNVKGAYYRAVVRPSVPEEVVERELKQFDAPRAKSKANVSRYEERARRAAEALGENKRLVERIGKFRKDLQEKKATIFKSNNRAFSECLLLVNQAEARIRERVDILGRLTGAYSNTISTLNDTMRLLTFIVAELSVLIGVLSRSEYAVTWDGFTNIMADMGTFLKDIQSYIVQFSFTAFIAGIQDSFRQPFSLFMFILQLILLLFLLFAIRAVIDWAMPRLLQSATLQEGVARPLRYLLIMVAQYIRNYFVGISIWVMFLAALFTLSVPDPYLYIFFYLLSIPFLLYATRQFMHHFREFNQQYEYVFVSQEFERRFMYVASGLLYATVAITLFREAFKLANYYKSELPTILLAVNFIIFQTALMLLLTKDLILNLIPGGNTPFWRDFFKALRGYIDRYFILIQLCVFAIIVMSNPYVGFGKLVLYMFRAFILTSLLSIGLYWLYGQFKQGVSRLFFVSADDVVHERFVNAKTWFGVIIVVSFGMFMVFGGFIVAKIWGWAITAQDVLELVHEPLMFKGTPDPITLLSLTKISIFIFGGFVFSYVLNRFVLNRIFDLFLVEAGVQHTVTSIGRYLVIGTAIMFGFTYVGLGQHIGVLLAALVFSIGWVLKDPISDFAAYFIILVQRPLKIGDYIQVDAETSGVVRKITPRSVVLRRKNSTTLIIPNSYVMNHSIENWNYTRNFVAVNDIVITVEYTADPQKVKELLHQVVEEHSNVLRNPKPIVRLDDFGVYGYIFMVRGYISPIYVLEMWDIASDMRLGMIKRLREHGIFVAVPVRKLFDSKPGVEFGYNPDKVE